MTIRNAGGKDAVVAAAVNVPEAVVELHDIRNGRMEKVDRIPVPSRDAVELKPKSHHIMIFNLPKDLKDGSELSLTLRFEKSGEQQVPVTVVKQGASQARGR